jgi:quercetin dioxygenase-like cupin family protein
VEYGDATIIGDVTSTGMERARPPIYDRDVELRLLYQDPRSGAEHYVVRYPPGLKALPHRHSAAHTIVVLAGRLEANGLVVGPGAYCHFPAGDVMHHAPAGEEGCTFVIVFDGPFDVEVVASEPGDGPAA